MTAVFERPLSVPLTSAWSVVTAAQTQPGALDETAARPSPVVPARVPWAVPLTGGATVHGYLQILDLDTDYHVASVAFTGRVAGSARIRSTELTVSLTEASARSCLYRVHTCADTGAGSSTMAATVARQIADAVETSIRPEAAADTGPSGQSRRHYWTLAAVVSLAGLLGITVITRYVRHCRRAGNQAGCRP